MCKVLIVDDENALTSVISDYLGEYGYETRTASNGVEAVEYVRSFHPNLIVMDLMMPQLTGGEAARILRLEPETASIPILVISGVEDVADIADVLPIDATLNKPFRLDDLRERIDRLLSCEVPSPVPEQVSSPSDD